MTDYSPPTEDLPIFNSSVFLSGDEPLTFNEAKKKFLRFPNAQGSENFQDINVNGNATFNTNSTTNIIVKSNTNQTILNQIDNTFTIENQSITSPEIEFNLYSSASTTFQPLLLTNNTTYVNPSITYPDNKVQNSAFTGAGALSGSYTNTNITIDSNGKITALSNGSTELPYNVEFNSLNISALPNQSTVSSSGINNQYNMGGFYGQYPLNGTGPTQTYIPFGSYFAPLRPIKIQFVKNTGASGVPSMSGQCCAFDLECFFYQNGTQNWGQTSCKLIIFFQALSAPWGNSTSTIYNINNKINGNGNFYMTDATYAPFGRQFWTYNQTFSGTSGGNAYLYGQSVSSEIFEVCINFVLPSSSYNYYYWIKNLTTNTAQVNAGSNGNTGVIVFS